MTDQLAAHEIAENPDAGNSYGFQGLDDDCKAKFPPPDPNNPNGPPGPEPEPGDVNPNPYAVAIGRDGNFYVADAGGNDILRVSKSGRISTLVVLPPVPFTVTAEVAAGMGLPECTVDATYNFHPVPTDVEVGRDGMLYVSGLPGGPEDESLGSRGVVFRVNPWTGRVRTIASGFLGAVDLALDDHGRIYVAELFGGRITKVGHRGNTTVAEVDAPGAVEYADGRLYLTVGNGFPNFGQPLGSVITIRL